MLSFNTVLPHLYATPACPVFVNDLVLPWHASHFVLRLSLTAHHTFCLHFINFSPSHPVVHTRSCAFCTLGSAAILDLGYSDDFLIKCYPSSSLFWETETHCNTHQDYKVYENLALIFLEFNLKIPSWFFEGLFFFPSRIDKKLWLPVFRYLVPQYYS